MVSVPSRRRTQWLWIFRLAEKMPGQLAPRLAFTWQKAFALGTLTCEFARPPDRLTLLPRALLRRFFVVFPQFHLAPNALALHLFL